MRRFAAIILCFAVLLSGSITASAGSEAAGSTLGTGIFEAIGALLNMKKIIGTAHTGEVSRETWSADDEYKIEDTAVLFKEKGRDFVVLNITDIHLSDYDERALLAFPAFATVRRLVRQLKPDLITVTGDIVCGDSAVYSIKRFTRVMNSFGIPWAPLFGNHEGEGNCDYNYLADIMMQSKTCLLKKGAPEMGVGNYVVNIAQKDGDDVEYVHSLILMDTHRSHVNEKQIEWYEWAARGICNAAGGEVESSVLFHIPLAEYQTAFDAAWDAENACWRDGFEARGELNEKICCHRDSEGNPINNGFFAAAKRVGTTKNIICGHEHINDFSILYEGIRLSYTLKVGMGSGFKAGMNGGTRILINESGLTLENIRTL